jgi:hypothetical protein
VYIACNAGARIGLVDELKSRSISSSTTLGILARVSEYLYLSDEDYEAIPKESVIVRKVPEG